MSDSVGYIELVNLIGPRAAFDMVLHHGGKRVYVPLSEQRGSLMMLVGQEAYQKLTARYAGIFLLIPARSSALQYLRDMEIAEFVTSKKGGYGEAAHHFGVSRSKVVECVKKFGKVPCQS